MAETEDPNLFAFVVCEKGYEYNDSTYDPKGEVPRRVFDFESAATDWAKEFVSTGLRDKTLTIYETVQNYGDLQEYEEDMDVQEAFILLAAAMKDEDPPVPGSRRTLKVRGKWPFSGDTFPADHGAWIVDEEMKFPDTEEVQIPKEFFELLAKAMFDRFVSVVKVTRG